MRSPFWPSLSLMRMLWSRAPHLPMLRRTKSKAILTIPLKAIQGRTYFANSFPRFLRLVVVFFLHPCRQCICVPSTQYNYTCPVGSFCPSNGSEHACTQGFFCPANVSQPTFCCAGYYCPTPSSMLRCPSGHFCPLGVEAPVVCPSLSNCEEGSVNNTQFGTILFIVSMMIIITALFRLQDYYVTWRKARRAHRIEFSSEERAEKEGTVATPGRATQHVDHDIAFRAGDGSIETTKTGWNAPGGGVADSTASIELKNVDLKQARDAPDSDGLVRARRETPDVETHFDIVYRNLSLVLPGGRTIMRGVSGRFQRSRLTAIMGPSGAGKSTLLNLVLGKAKRTNGEVFLNGKKDELFNYSELVGYVPQEDVMLRQLTVYEVLAFSARRRLPVGFNKAKIHAIITDIIRFLEIDHIVNSTIGDEATRGVSGGQRKRVNIGMELVANPSCLFLDEPTSGLDSVTATVLATLLARLSHSRGLTVAAIIHSPSEQCFAQFDDFVLLGTGGEIVYNGPCSRVAEYLGHVGFVIPSGENPADFALEVTMGRVSRRVHVDDEKKADEKNNSGGDEETVEFEPRDLFGLWRNQGAAWRPKHLKVLTDPDAEVKEHSAHVDQNAVSGIGYAASRLLAHAGSEWQAWASDVWSELSSWTKSLFGFGRAPARRVAGSLKLYYLCLVRAFTQVYRDKSSFMRDLAMHIGLGLFLSVAGANLVFVGPMPNEACAGAPFPLVKTCASALSNPYAGIGVFVIWAVSFAAMAVGATTFGPEQVQYWRHASTGLPTLPYFLAKVTMDLPRLTIGASLFMAAFRTGYTSLGNINRLFGFIWMTYWVGFNMGYFISLVVEPRNVSLYSVLWAMLWVIVFSGVSVSLSEIDDEYTRGLSWVWQVSSFIYLFIYLFLYFPNRMCVSLSPSLPTHTRADTYVPNHDCNVHLSLLTGELCKMGSRGLFRQ